MNRGTNDAFTIERTLETRLTRTRLPIPGVWAPAPAPWVLAAEDEAVDALWIDIGGSG